MIFALCYVAALLYIADVTTETILIFLGLLFCGWLYIAVPSLSISFRRLHDAHQSVLWAFIPQVTLFYGISEFAIGIPPNLIIWAILSFFTLCAFIFMSLPSYPSDVSRISAKDEK